jgi:hypothetical protein
VGEHGREEQGILASPLVAGTRRHHRPSASWSTDPIRGLESAMNSGACVGGQAQRRRQKVKLGERAADIVTFWGTANLKVIFAGLPSPARTRDVELRNVSGSGQTEGGSTSRCGVKTVALGNGHRPHASRRLARAWKPSRSPVTRPSTRLQGEAGLVGHQWYVCNQPWRSSGSRPSPSRLQLCPLPGDHPRIANS